MEDTVPVIELKKVTRTATIPQEDGSPKREEREVFILRRSGGINTQLCSENPGMIERELQGLSDEQLAVMLIQCGSLELGINHILTQALIQEFERRLKTVRRSSRTLRMIQDTQQIIRDCRDLGQMFKGLISGA